MKNRNKSAFKIIDDEPYNLDLASIAALIPGWTHYTITQRMPGDIWPKSYEYQWVADFLSGMITIRREFETEHIRVIHIGRAYENFDDVYEYVDCALSKVCKVLISYNEKNLITKLKPNSINLLENYL